MQPHWDDSQPIYIQVRERAIGMILDGTLGDGDPLPSVRTVASDLRLNPITVSKAYQSLVEDDLVERRRGLGMFVRAGARQALLESERQKFLAREWPAVLRRMQQLGIEPERLLETLEQTLDQQD